MSPQSVATAASEEAEKATAASKALSQSYRFGRPLGPPSGGSVCARLPHPWLKRRSLMAWTEMTKVRPPTPPSPQPREGRELTLSLERMQGSSLAFILEVVWLSD